MRLILKNIGILDNTTINIDGITVITGPNNSGKSTIGKALHAIIDATEQVEELSFIAKRNYIMSKMRALLTKMAVQVRPGQIKPNQER